MTKLMKSTLVSALMATGAMAATSTIGAGKTLTVLQEGTGTEDVVEGELEILSGHILEMQGTATDSMATIAMGAGTKLTVSGRITVQTESDEAYNKITSTAGDGETKPEIILNYHLNEPTTVTGSDTGLNETYKELIGDSGATWTVYDADGGYIDSHVAYDPDLFTITESPVEIKATNDSGTDTTIYDLDKNGGNGKFVVTATDASIFYF